MVISGDIQKTGKLENLVYFSNTLTIKVNRKTK